MVTEKSTNLIDTSAGPQWFPGSLITSPSAGMTPFGLNLATEARSMFPKLPVAPQMRSSISSYKIEANGSLSVLPLRGYESDRGLCWVAVNPGNRVVYTTNTGSASLTGFAISPTGTLTLLTPAGRPE